MSKKCIFLKKNFDFQGSGGRSWEQKSIQNQSKFEVQHKVPLGIDFCSILVDFGGQVGFPNPPKIDQKWHRKNDEKKKGAKMAKQSQQEAPTTLDPPPPGPWEGVGGGDKSPPRGVETRRVERRGVENRHPTLDHPSPEGWWESFQPNCTSFKYSVLNFGVTAAI